MAAGWSISISFKAVVELSWDASVKPCCSVGVRGGERLNTPVSTGLGTVHVLKLSRTRNVNHSLAPSDSILFFHPEGGRDILGPAEGVLPLYYKQQLYLFIFYKKSFL